MEEPLPGEEAFAPVVEPELEAAPEAALELEVEQEPERPVADGAGVATEELEPAEEALEARTEAPSPARGSVIMSCGVRTRDGD